MRHAAATTFLKRVFEELDAAPVPYCVERNYEEYPDNITGDVDLVVSTVDFPAAVEAMSRAAKRHNWRVFVCYTSTQAVHIGFFSDVFPERFCLVIELFNGGVWRGMTYLPADRILDRRLKHNDTWKPHPAHEAIITLVHYLLYNSAVCDKYRERIHTRYLEAPDVFQSELVYGFGRNFASEIDGLVAAANWSRLEERAARVRRGLLLHSFLQRPFESCRGIATIKADVSRKPEGVVIDLHGIPREQADGLADAMIDVAIQWHVFLPPTRRKVDLSRGDVGGAARVIAGIEKTGGVAFVVNPDSLVLPVAELREEPFVITSQDGLLTVNNSDCGLQLTSRAATDAAYESWAFILGQRASKRD
jgi:hypothetical protein